MTAVDVAAIGIEEDRFLVGSERPLFDFAIPRGEELRRASFRRELVQVLPAIFFGGYDQLIVSGPIQDASAGVFRHIRKGALGRGAAVPAFFCGTGSDVRNADCPGMRFVRRNKKTLRGV